MLSGARVLVTGARLPAALEIARALRAAGAEVWAADSLWITPTGASRCVKGYLRLPSPALDPAGFRAGLLHALRRHEISLVVPASEEVFALARLRQEFEPRTQLFAPGFAQLRALHSKWQVLKLAAGLGVRIPETERALSREALQDLVRRHPDWIVKPEFSRGGYHARVGMPPAGELVSAQRPWLAQEFIAGREISTFAIVSRGRVTASATYLPKYRLGRGASLYFDPHPSPAADAFVARFAATLGMTGQAGFDFIETPAGELALLECNPRATSGVHLLGDGWARSLLGEDVRVTGQSRPCCSRFGVLSLHGLRAWRNRQWRQLRADLARSRDSCARRGDLWPIWALPLSSAEIALRSLAWPVSAAQAYTYDLEWNGEES